MPNVSLHFSASIVDGFGIRRTTEVFQNTPDTTTLAQLSALLGTWLQDLDAIIDGAIVSSRALIQPTPPTSLKLPTGTTWGLSRANQIGLLRFSATATTKHWSNNLPSLSNAKITSGKINLADTAVSAYIALLTTGANNYTNPDNLALVALVDAFITSRTTRQQSLSKSAEA